MLSPDVIANVIMALNSPIVPEGSGAPACSDDAAADDDILGILARIESKVDAMAASVQSDKPSSGDTNTSGIPMGLLSNQLERDTGY